MIKPNGQSWLDSRLLLLLLAANDSPSIPSDASNLIEANTAIRKNISSTSMSLTAASCWSFGGPMPSLICLLPHERLQRRAYRWAPTQVPTNHLGR
jgi:hypothetical protein